MTAPWAIALVTAAMLAGCSGTTNGTGAQAPSTPPSSPSSTATAATAAVPQPTPAASPVADRRPGCPTFDVSDGRLPTIPLPQLRAGTAEALVPDEADVLHVIRCGYRQGVPNPGVPDFRNPRSERSANFFVADLNSLTQPGSPPTGLEESVEILIIRYRTGPDLWLGTSFAGLAPYTNGTITRLKSFMGTTS